MNDSENLRDSIQDLAESISQSLGDTVVEHVFHLYGIKDVHTASVHQSLFAPHARRHPEANSQIRSGPHPAHSHQRIVIQ